MKMEDLTNEGFTEDQAKKIVQMHKKAIDGNFVPKATFEAEREKLKNANDTIADRDKQIAELGKFKGNAEELQNKVDELTAQNKKNSEEYEKKLKDVEETTAIRAAVADHVYNPDDVLSKLDRTKMTIQEGKVVAGLVEQMDAIKKDSPHYFKQVKYDSKGGWPGGWNPFGKSPEESVYQGGADSAAEFGKSLAKVHVQGMNSTQKAADIYFK